MRHLMGLGVAVLGLVLAGCGPSPEPVPEQPIAYNHQVHVEGEELECTRCHLGAETQNEAGLPPMAVCAGCHRRQATDHPEVVKFMEQYQEGEPIVWRRVNHLPDKAMVHFKHKPHARAGVGCENCHGDVGSMTVARQVVNTANMGWCVDCHREQEASIDCLTCHH
ncbi:MAG: cytochrome c3 family protein [Gemmatimonadota bacterium]